MKKLLVISIFLLSAISFSYAGFFGGGGGTGTDEVGTVTNGKWCVGDSGGLIQCTEDAPAGAGDVTGTGDCAAGACLDGTSDGGTYIRLYDGDSNYSAIVSSDVAANKTITLPPDTATLATLGLAETFAGIKSFTANPRIYDGSHYLTIDADGLTGDATITFGANTNNLTIVNGTATVDIAAAATLNLDTSLTVDTAAVTLKGKSGGSTITLPTALDLDETMTDANLCKYTASGTKISCDVAIGTNVQAYDAELAAVAGLTFADVSVIQLTGAAAAAVLTSDGASKVIASNAANDAIEFTTVTAAHLDPVLTFANGDLIDLSGITHSGSTDEGFVLPTWANVSPTSDKKFLAADGSSLKLYNGGWVTIGATAAPTDATYLTLSNDATLTGERVFTEGLAIDFTDAGANSTLTIAFDPTELTGDRTWAAGGAATNTWTWNVSTGTDPSLTFGNDNVLVNNTMTVTKLITGNAGLTVATGQNVTVGTTQWNSGDEIDGTKIKDADLGDVVINEAGAWAVEDDSHAHGSTTITLASTNLSDTSALGYLAGTNTWTENNVFGNANSDTLTIRSTIKGSGRAVTIDDDGTASPSYATGTQELFVTGDIETAGTIYAAAANFGSGTDGSRSVTLTSNSALTPSGNQIYFIGDVLYFSQGGSSPAQKTPARLEDAQTFTGKKTFQGDIAVGDASNAGSIDMYDGSSNYLQLQVPSLSAEYTMIFPTGAGTTGQYLKTTTSGTTSTLSWDTPSASADTTGGTGGVQFNAAGVLTSDAGFVFTTATDKLALGSSGGSTTGTLDLYYTGTTYAATITPNSGMSADVTITLPDNTSTLIGSGANTFTGSQIFSNASNNSTVAVATLTGVPALNGSDVHRGIYFAPTGSVLGTITSTGNTVAFIDLAAITGDAETNLYGMRLGNLTGTTGSAGEVEYGISIGTGWDRGISTASPVYIGDGTNGTTISTTGGQSFAGSATFTAASATSSVPWVVGSGTAANTAEGTAYWESDTDILTIGDGATGIGLDFTANTIITFPSATSTLAILGANTFTAKQTIDATTGIQVGSTGVLITSDNDGAITLLGASGGYDEDLTINLDDTENTAVVSSSTGVTKLDFSALNLATTGTIQAGITISSDADGMDASAMTSAGMYGTMFIATGAGTWILPRAALGMSACLMDSGTAHDLILDVTAGSTIRLKGTEQADGVGITNAAGTSTGDFVCVVAVATDKWSTVGMGGSWVSQ